MPNKKILHDYKPKTTHTSTAFLVLQNICGTGVKIGV
jgi:hypothetical protein